jgi:Cdc6-like AAA superfamily ATPase
VAGRRQRHGAVTRAASPPSGAREQPVRDREQGRDHSRHGECGDARLALGILRTAASTADRESRDRITDDILLDAADDARARIKQKGLGSLTPHRWVVYDTVREHGPLGPSEIYVRYTEEVDDPRTKRTIRTYLSKMEQYNLLEAKGTSRDREYSLVDSAAASPMQ